MTNEKYSEEIGVTKRNPLCLLNLLPWFLIIIAAFWYPISEYARKSEITAIMLIIVILLSVIMGSYYIVEFIIGKKYKIPARKIND